MSSRRLLAALVTLAVLLGAAWAVAGDPTPAERLASGWGDAPDAARGALLDAALAAPSRASFDAVVKAARVSLGVGQEAKRLRRAFDDYRRNLGDAVRDDDPRLARDRAEVENLARQAAREVAALDRLAAAAGRLLDAVPEADAAAAAKDLLRAASDAGLDGLRAWIGQAVGASRLPRTAVVLMDTAGEAQAEIGKLQTERAVPAKKLDDVVRKLNDAVDRYLKAARAKGDNSGLVPAGLVGTLPAQKADLEKVVNRLNEGIEAADQRRLAAREALAGVLAGAAPADADHLLDLVESRLLKDDDVEVRAFGLLALGPVPGARALRLLSLAADGRDPRDASAAIEALGGRPEPETVAILARRLGQADADWRIRSSAAAALARTGRAAAVPPLLDAMKGATGRLLDDLRAALVALTGQSFVAAESPWRAWWDVAGQAFRGPKDPGATAPPTAGAAGPPGAVAAPAAGEGGVDFYGIQTHSTRVLFVLDFSGSMNWAGSERDAKVTKVEVLRQEMKKALAGLPDGSTFGVVGFSTDVRMWQRTPQVRSGRTAADALEWVQKAVVEGGTNIGDALEAAFRLMGAGLAKDRNEPPAYDTVFFMTDGKPTVGKMRDPRQLLGAVRRWNEGRKVRIHVVGVGGHRKPASGPAAPGGAWDPEDDIDVEFLKALAAENGGQCVIR